MKLGNPFNFYPKGFLWHTFFFSIPEGSYTYRGLAGRYSYYYYPLNGIKAFVIQQIYKITFLVFAQT